MTHLKFFWPTLFFISVLALACKTRSGGIQNESSLKQEVPASTTTVPTEIGAAASDSIYIDWTLPPKPQTIQFRATDSGGKFPRTAYQLTVTD